MSYGKYEKKGKPLAFLTVTLIVLLVLVCSFSGVAAYLAKGPANNAVNSFEAAQPLNAQVVVQDGKSCVDVGDPGYAVYVRAAVIPNWKQDGSVILTAPDNFTITPGEDWVKHTDGFFYYTKPISSGLTSPIYTSVTANRDPGGEIEVDVAVQAIQALGTTDAVDAVTAVLDAWGVQPDDL